MQTFSQMTYVLNLNNLMSHGLWNIPSAIFYGSIRSDLSGIARCVVRFNSFIPIKLESFMNDSKR